MKDKKIKLKEFHYKDTTIVADSTMEFRVKNADFMGKDVTMILCDEMSMIVFRQEKSAERMVSEEVVRNYLHYRDMDPNGNEVLEGLKRIWTKRFREK